MLKEGYFLQQALEKFLKAYLIRQGWRLERTHALDKLLEAAVAHDAALDTFAQLCIRVADYYLAQRYPDVQVGSASLERIRADLAKARRLIVALFPDERME
ncbi:MAG: HEPN domain-containing protein [Chloroflexi bacterium]|nr:HEPN domain-containing protein [Chloroflexota bacterium]